MNTNRTQLQSIFERWQRLEEAKAEVSQDLKELFAEAKGNGFDSKQLRKAFNYVQKQIDNPEQLSENQAVFDLYVDSLTRDAHEGAE